MKICRTIPEIRAAVADLRAAGSVGLVTTMGALHDGHMALVARAAKDHPSVVATIFVNPTQFGEAADLDAYPRTEDADIAMLRAAGVSAVFLPDVAAIYPDGAETIVETTRLARILHGGVRPGHFRGVATVVTKLFNIVQPDAAYFGEKDYQQLAVIRRMVTDLHVPIAIHGVPTVRAADGLALSSRNLRLAAEDRAAAPVLHRALTQGVQVLRDGGTAQEAEATIRSEVAREARAALEGLDIVAADTFIPLDGPATGPVGLMISARFGEVLLIDQKEITP
ncbi:pantoate--beta-alanine ligase [Salipiger sp. IMCC34102]|uniref:pantoate--beta-alanine ligase n=1 Tax=Salipiger sp. IMCC34102 TaxID=2510647 RepID=UPI00101CA690|nr:pantoate--beta-alanine ligase [Salipiger sp. IMCC34102]RYH01427.1 pantoate--beta-alanine ligase [Salipiger sp. IMCC34102]